MAAILSSLPAQSKRVPQDQKLLADRVGTVNDFFVHRIHFLNNVTVLQERIRRGLPHGRGSRVRRRQRRFKELSRPLAISEHPFDALGRDFRFEPNFVAMPFNADRSV